MISNVNREAVSWRPETDADHLLVQQELSTILSSHHFRNSKRYPALLRYVVEKSLDGKVDQLKERTLGVEVFGRRPDYDTNADPVVRAAAGEIRKKIAQYYQECNGESEIQICLPLGSYVPEFTTWLAVDVVSETRDFSGTHTKITVHAESSSAAHPAPSLLLLNDSPAVRRKISRPSVLAAICLIVALFGAVGYRMYRLLTPEPVDKLWGPILETAGPVLIVVSGQSLELTSPEPSQTSLFDHMIGPYHHVSVSTAIAMSRLTAVLQEHNKGYVVKEASVTGLPDLRERSVILVGALNNEWTLRLIQPLRYRFVKGPLARIEDTQNLPNRDWTVDFSQPFTSVTHDFAVVARYHDPSTNGTVLIVAGLGPYGTEAAGQFVTTSQYIEEVSKQVPNGLKNDNLEMVIRTDIIAGEAGPPRLVAAYRF